VKVFDARKTGIIGLPYGEKTMTISRFHTIPACHGQTDRQTDGQTDRIGIAISRVSSRMLTRDKKHKNRALTEQKDSNNINIL